MKLKIFRHLVQLVAVAFLIAPIYYTDTIWYGTFLSADLLGLFLTDPFTALEITLASKTFHQTLFLSIVPLVVMGLVLGRVFCSFVCPLNLVFELIPYPKIFHHKNRFLPLYAAGVFLLIALIISYPVFNAISPVFELQRAILFGFGVEAVIIALVLIAGFIWGRKAWCQTLCPIGAVYGVLGLKRLVNVRVDHSKCKHCGKCTKNCTMATSPDAHSLAHDFVCTNCGDCISSCPNGAVSYKVGWGK